MGVGRIAFQGGVEQGAPPPEPERGDISDRLNATRRSRAHRSMSSLDIGVENIVRHESRRQLAERICASANHGITRL